MELLATLAAILILCAQKLSTLDRYHCQCTVYTTTGYTGNEMDLVYTATRYSSNNIDLGCTTVGNIEFTALGTV